MEKINLYNERSTGSTSVPNAFIDCYMPQANGDYVKIFLYLMRCMNRQDCDFSISKIADEFEMTEKDVIRALKYWERVHLLRLEYSDTMELTGICILSESLCNTENPAASSRHAASQTDGYNSLSSSDCLHTSTSSETTRIAHFGHSDQAEASGAVTHAFIQAAEQKQISYTSEQIAEFCEQEDVAEMVYMAESYMGRSLSQNDLSVIFSWYDQLHLSADLIEFLIENCVAKGHTSVRYMEKIAEDFAAKKIRTVEEAREMLAQDSEVYRTVMRSFGIRGRNLVPAERRYLTRWNRQMGFSCEMIEEACTRTIQSIHEPNFEYTDTILSNWQKEGIFEPSQIRSADESFRKRKKRTARQNTNQNSKTQFSNFRQRENNYDELQKQLLRKSLR